MSPDDIGAIRMGPDETGWRRTAPKDAENPARQAGTKGYRRRERKYFSPYKRVFIRSLPDMFEPVAAQMAAPSSLIAPLSADDEGESPWRTP